MDDVTLKPCRWCGGKAKCNELRRGNYKREGDNYQVVCNKCRARGPLIQDSSAQAISAWNQRADAQVEADAYAEGYATALTKAAQDVEALVSAARQAERAAAVAFMRSEVDPEWTAEYDAQLIGNIAAAIEAGEHLA